MALGTWSCTSCGRRVPATVAVCRCGMPRGAAEVQSALSAASTATRADFGVRLRDEPLPWQVKISLGVIALALVMGVANLFLHHEEQPIVPLLGYVDKPLS